MTLTLMPPPDSRMGSVAGQLPLLARVSGWFSAALTLGEPPHLDGADLSHYNVVTDWTALRASTSWVAHKATQSVAYVDPTFAGRWPQMGQGFTHRLAYHWLSPSVSPTQQAAHYLNTVGPFAPGAGAMLDAEQGGITATDVLEWCETVEQTTHRPAAVYTGAYVAGGTIWQSTAIRTSKYGPRPMHLAAYTTEARALALPGVKAYPWSAWQYSSNGPVPGVTGRCDMNRVDNRAAYDLACGVTAPQPPPNPSEDTLNYYVVTGATAKFIGLPPNVSWTGPGGAKVDAAIATQLAAGNLVQVDLTGGPNAFGSTFLTGPLPTGDTLHTWTGDEFAALLPSAAPPPQGEVVDVTARSFASAALTRVVDLDRRVVAGADAMKAPL